MLATGFDHTAKATDFPIFTVDLKELPSSFYKINKNALDLTSKFYVLQFVCKIMLVHRHKI
jgi:hypothetical protein